MQKKEIVEVTSIGGRLTGMFLALCACMRVLNTKINESLLVLAEQLEIMYHETYIFDISTFTYITGSELIQQLAKQMEPFETEICLEETVIEIKKKDDFFVLETNEAVHYSKTILITSGQGSFEPRKLTFDYNEDYEDTNLHYYVSNLESYRDKTVVICGGGDSAVDWALTLEDIAKKVYIVHRRDKFRAHEAAVTLMENSSIEMVTP